MSYSVIHKLLVAIRDFEIEKGTVPLNDSIPDKLRNIWNLEPSRVVLLF